MSPATFGPHQGSVDTDIFQGIGGTSLREDSTANPCSHSGTAGSFFLVFGHDALMIQIPEKTALVGIPDISI